jgi:putative membrane protein
MTSFMAFLHHIAAFALVAAGVVLAVGLLRVFYFEKGAGYYFHNGAFLAKLALFLLVAALSIYPTLRFLAWRKGAAVDPQEVRLVRKLVHVELLGIVFILLFAALMADGIGFPG